MTQRETDVRETFYFYSFISILLFPFSYPTVLMSFVGNAEISIFWKLFYSHFLSVKYFPTDIELLVVQTLNLLYGILWDIIDS